MKKELRKRLDRNFPRSALYTPTVAGDLVYVENGNGTVFCLNAETGKTV